MNDLLSTTDLAQWTAWKHALVDITDLDRDALHIYAGVALQIAVALLTRRKLGDWLPWVAVAAVAIVVEVADVKAEYWHSLALQIGKSVHDVLNTLILPTCLLVLSRFRAQLFGRS